MFIFDWFSAIITFIFDVWEQLAAAPNPFMAGAIFLYNGGWILVVLVLWSAFVTAWHEWRQVLYQIKNRRFIMLAIDIPRDNEQSPKSVESIFAHLHGVLPGRNNKYEEWWLGKTPDFFSLELVSIDGYVQFLVRTQVEYRDLVESAFYAQYPEAEITEVEDYVYGSSGEFNGLTFPNDQYNMLGSEFVLAKHFAYPIRLYIEFEHSLSQEYKDPMAALLETMNRMGPGEQMWLQIVATPRYNEDWQPEAHNTAMKIAGKFGAEEETKGILDELLGQLLKWLDALAAAVFPFYAATEEKAEKDELPSLMLHLTPTERSQVEGIQKKADKVSFWCKFRFIYIAKKEIFSKARSLSPLSGVIKQFASLNNNSLVAHKLTKTWGLDYWLVPQRTAWRQNKILRNYQNRSRSRGSRGITLNIEELASIYHFPTIYVKAPLVARTQAKRASAPITLPLETPPPWQRFRERRQAATGPAPVELPVAENTRSVSATPEPAGAPENLPFV